MEKSLDMTTGSPARLLLQFTLPTLAGNLLHQVYSITDSIVVGQCLGQTALAAVGCTMPVVMLLAAMMVGINMGVGILIGQAFGRKDHATIRRAFINSLYLGLLLAAVLTVSGITLAEPILRLMGTPPTPLREAAVYLRINFITSICPLFYYLFSSAFRGLGDSKTALYCLIVSVIANVSLDVLFVAVLGWGVAGSAWATALAQGLSAIFAAVLLYRRYPIMRLQKGECAFDAKLFGQISGLAVPIALQSAFNNLGNLAAQSAVNTFGEVTMAAYTAAGRIGTLALMPLETIGSSLAVYAAQNHGAGRADRVRGGVRAALVISLVTSAVLAAVMLFGGRALAGLFLTDPSPALVQVVQSFLLITAVPGALAGIMYIYQQVLRGINLPNQSLIGGLMQLVGKIGVAVLGAWVLHSPDVVWLGWPVSFVLGTIVPYLCYRSYAGAAISSCDTGAVSEQ